MRYILEYFISCNKNLPLKFESYSSFLCLFHVTSRFFKEDHNHAYNNDLENDDSDTIILAVVRKLQIIIDD